MPKILPAIIIVVHYVKTTLLHTNSKHGERKQIKDAQALTRREMAMGGLLLLLMKSLFSTTLLKGALERRAKNLYS